MTLALVVKLLGVSVLIVMGTVREYRLLHRSGLPQHMLLLHIARMLGILVLGFGLLGALLDNGGYDGEPRFAETVRVGVIFGGLPFLQHVDVVGSTKLGELSEGAIGWGVQLVLVCTLGLWWSAWHGRPSSRAGA